ncbi:MAG: type I glyceraldehyde-3-phosphate dehydrogenase, partial [Actinobacteria bacterium]|nr:type I glyceraldehyde-3-phosphate dehydrogenase [Actinomycetota bacterium]
MPTRVGINGFGRIGRNFFRAARAKGSDLDVVAVNDITDPASLAHLLKYDSIFGRVTEEIKVVNDGFTFAGAEVKVVAERDPAALP